MGSWFRVDPSAESKEDATLFNGGNAEGEQVTGVDYKTYYNTAAIRERWLRIETTGVNTISLLLQLSCHMFALSMPVETELGYL